MIDLGRDITSDSHHATQREWLVTNGIGGFASGTIANGITRRYHGALVAALQPPLGRTVLISKFEDIATYDNETYNLFTNQWASVDNDWSPRGYQHLERFHLEGTTPVWTYAVGDAQLEKRLWMHYGDNTTYVTYTLKRASLPLDLDVKVTVNHTDMHINTPDADITMQLITAMNGVQVLVDDDSPPLYILSDKAIAAPHHDWYRGYILEREHFRGQDDVAAHLHAVTFHITLNPGETVLLIATTNADASTEAADLYTQKSLREGKLIVQSKVSDGPDWIRHLVLAADQFIVKRRAGADQDTTPIADIKGRSVIAGYHWFGDWGRDTMISLPGLTLTTGRTAEAAQILRTYAAFVDEGMIPNRFPDSGEAPEYNTVDATLWYVQAIGAYYQATHDDTLLRDLWPILQDIIAWHKRGTRYNIHVDDADGLLYSGEDGVQLTWMDAKIEGWVVTPRTGKAVEINALWYNALHHMAHFARVLDEDGSDYDADAVQVKASFGKFWSEQDGYLYDVIDTPDGTSDASLRPNQLFAVSLPHSPLEADQQKAVVDSCARHLVTSMGLRSLAPAHPDYSGTYGGDGRARDSVYHQGPVWAWLIGPFVAAHFRVYQNVEAARAFLMPFKHHLQTYGVGSIAELAEGDAPHHPRAAIAQAWSVAEVLRAWHLVSSGMWS